MENEVDWKSEAWKMKCRNEDSETKHWQQGYSVLTEQVRFEGIERSEARVQMDSGSGREGSGSSGVIY